MKRRSSWLALAVALAAWLACTLPARAEGVTLEQYRTRLAAAIAAIEGAADPRAALAEVTEGLAAITSVRLPNGLDLPLHEPLLGGSKMSPQVALLRLRAAEEQIRLSAGDDLAARQALLASILERREFSGSEALIERLLRRIERWWESLWANQEVSPQVAQAEDAATNAIGLVLRVTGGIVVVALLAWWLRRFIAGFVGDAELRRRLAAGEEMPLTAAEARRAATEQARAGSYREAVRSLYLAALLSLEERGVIVSDRTLTNRELLARAGPGQEVRAHLAPVVSTFDEVWYGVREPNAAAFDAYEREVDALNALPAPPLEAEP